MPVSRRTRDADQSPPSPALAPTLRTPQARVLAALMPTNPTDPPIDWPVLTRKILDIRAGYTGKSGTITRALNGIKGGSSSGDPHPGLLVLGMVEVVVFDIDGVDETNYKITTAGIAAYQAHVAAKGKLPKVKGGARNTNRRYRR